MNLRVAMEAGGGWGRFGEREPSAVGQWVNDSSYSGQLYGRHAYYT